MIKELYSVWNISKVSVQNMHFEDGSIKIKNNIIIDAKNMSRVIV